MVSYRQSQLIIPALAALSENQARGLKTRELYDRIAEQIDLEPHQRTETVTYGKHSYRAFDRNVRWTQQKLREAALAVSPSADHWTITTKGRRALRVARPGLVITLYTTDRGVALWGACEDAAALIEDQSVNLIMTSPPYPLLRQKDYGNLDERDYLDWMLGLARQWGRKLTADGSLMLNLGDSWTRGHPFMSLYQERLMLRLHDELGYRLCQRFTWHNPAKMPAPAEWVTVRRVRVKPSTETIWWLSQSDAPKADNRRVLKDYSTQMQNRIAAGGERAAHRPSGHDRSDNAFGIDRGGAIPPSLIVAPNTQSNTKYITGCRAAGLPIHPARFPDALPEFCIRLTTETGDLVYDPFGGSGTTAAVAERLDRHWITSESCLDYAIGSRLRFDRTTSPCT